MAKKNKKNSKKKDWDEDGGGFLRNLREETLQAVIAVAFFVAGIFFIFAAFGRAGIAGEKIRYWLGALLGIGYFLLPILCILLGLTFFKSLRRNVPILQIGATFLFFISGLGLIEVLSNTRGGLIGGLIA